MSNRNDSSNEEQRNLRPAQVWGSILASAFGVQSARNRERDFTRGNAVHFIVAGIQFVILFVLGMVVLVHEIIAGYAP